MIASKSRFQFNWFDTFCFWYPPGWLILFNRHWRHYQPDPDGWNWLEYGLFLLPGGFYLAFALRWLRLGGRTPRPVASDPDPAYQAAFRQEILLPIVQRYFHATLEGLDQLPAKGSVIVALNHAGMCFPWDFMGLAVLLSQEESPSEEMPEASRYVQPLAHPIFFDHPWLKWWLPNGWAQVLGGVRANSRSFEAALSSSDRTPKPLLLYAPEGLRGLTKGWQHRYQLGTFDPSFIRLSIRHQIPILPVLCLGNEFLHPFAVNVRSFARWLRLPMFPVSPLVLLFALFPSLGAWAVRTRLRYFAQPLWFPWQEDLGAGKSVRETYELAERLRSRMQATLDQLRSAAGK